LGIGFLVLEEFKKNIDENTATVIHETILAPTTDGVYVSKNYTTAGIDCYNSFAVISMVNETSGTVIAAGNYSVDANTGKITNLSSFDKWPSVNVTYTYKYGLDSCGGVVSTINATKKIPTWLPIIVVILIIGVILVIVFRYAGREAGSGFGFGRYGGTVAEI
ncbi:MAG: hypothetical protein QXO70_03555, partial [Candidatus Pacearchaeota archaeon]